MKISEDASKYFSEETIKTVEEMDREVFEEIHDSIALAITREIISRVDNDIAQKFLEDELGE